MLVQTAIDRIRNIAGYYTSGTDFNDGSVDVNDNMVMQSMNNTLKDMCEKQYRPFLKTISLHEEDLTGSDLFDFGNSYEWTSKIPRSSTTPVRQYLPIPVKLQNTRVSFFYDERRMNGYNPTMFNSFIYTYFPNEHEQNIGYMHDYYHLTINAPDSITFHLERGISTFKTEFLFYNANNNKLLDRWTIYLNTEKSITYRSKSGVFLRVDFDSNFVECVYTYGNTPIRITYRSHENYAGAGSMLLYDGSLRISGARNGGIFDGIQIQAYCIPYYVLDAKQHIPKEVDGELLELFCYLSAKDIQTQTRSVDAELNQIVNDKLTEYQGLLDLKKVSESSYFPNISL